MTKKLLPHRSLRSEDLLLNLTFNWPILVGLVMICAFAAALVGYWLPRDFSAQVSILVDQNTAEALDTSNREAEATYLSRETVRLEALAYSDEVWANVREEMASRGWEDLPDENAALFDYVFSPHPMDGVWQFVAQHPDQQYALDLAGAWAGAFLDRVESGLENARALACVEQELETIQAAVLSEAEQIVIVESAMDAIEAAEMLEPEAGTQEDRQETYAEILRILSLLEEVPSFPENPADEAVSGLAADLNAWLKTRQAVGVEILAGLEMQQEERSVQAEELALQGMGLSPFLEVALLQEAVTTDNRMENTGYMAVFGALIGVILYIGWWLRDARPSTEHEGDHENHPS